MDWSQNMAAVTSKAQATTTKKKKKPHKLDFVKIKDTKGAIVDEMVGWHHRLSGQEFEQTLGDSKGQGSLVYCSPWGHKELDTTEQQKVHYWEMKRQHTGWEKIFANHTSNKSLVARIHKEFLQLKKKTTTF